MCKYYIINEFAVFEEVLSIVAPQTCPNGYNYNVELGYDVAFSGSNTPANLWTLQANILNCGDAATIFFDLPNQGGGGTLTTTSNPWRNQSDCATATLADFGCQALEITIDGPGIASQTLSLTPSSSNNGSGNNQDWCMEGNLSDTTKFLGTTNNSPLIMRTNNEERLRISEDGKVGIGIANPQEKLDLLGNARLSGDVIFSSYASPNDTLDRFIGIDNEGKTFVKNTFDLKNLIYADPYIQFVSACDLAGQPIQQNPSWYSSPFKLYVRCPDIFVGIGTDSPEQQLHVTHRAVFGQRVGIGNTDPQARLHIRTHLPTPSEKLFLIERQIGNNPAQAIFQITNDGLVRSREVKVDQDAWPDYVFTADYKLLPIRDLKDYIDEFGHLPNVPSAKTIETEGLELGATAKITMEKVEELTLYTIAQQEQLDEQSELIKDQQEQLDEQKAVIEAQQTLLEEQRALIGQQKKALEELMLIIGK